MKLICDEDGAPVVFSVTNNVDVLAVMISDTLPGAGNQFLVYQSLASLPDDKAIPPGELIGVNYGSGNVASEDPQTTKAIILAQLASPPYGALTVVMPE